MRKRMRRRKMEILNDKVSQELVKKIRHLFIQVAELGPELPDPGPFQYDRVANLLRDIRAVVAREGASVLPKYMHHMLSQAPLLEPRDTWTKSLQAKCRSLHEAMYRLIGMADLIAILIREEKEDEIDYSAE
jgi:hypothetical protein